MEQRRSYRIETFDPLLRDLAAWGLVERSGSPAKPTWRLSAEAQQRLDELVRPAERLSVEQLVYLDHLCAHCHQRAPTRLRQGLYLCEGCAERGAAAVAPPAELVPPSSGAKRLARLRHRPETQPGKAVVEPTKPLAG